MATWQSFLDKMKRDGKDVPSSDSIDAFLRESRESGVSFLKREAEDVERYLTLLAQGKIDTDDFKFLMTGVRAQTRAEMAVAKQQAQKRLRGFLEDLVDVLLKKVV